MGNIDPIHSSPPVMPLSSSAYNAVTKIAKSRIFVPLNAVGYVAASCVNKLCQAASWVTGVASRGERAHMLAKEIEEVNQELIDRSQQIRDSRQSGLNYVTTAAQAIPIIGTVATVASQIAEQERKAERAVTWWAKRYTKAAFEFMRYTAPYILSAANYVTTKAVHATGWLEGKFYRGMTNPEGISEHYRKMADRVEAARWKAMHPESQNVSLKTAPTITVVPEPHEKVPQLKPIDLTPISKDIVSEGSLYHTMRSIGTIGAYASRNAKSLFEAIGSSSIASYVASGLNKAALGLEILMILPYGKQVVASVLEKGGIPVYDIESTFAKMPALITKQAVAVEGKILEAARWTDGKIEQLDKASRVQELAEQQNALVAQTDTACTALSEAVVKECVDKGTKVICSDEVYEILKSKENILAYAKKLGMDPNSPEFTSAIRDLATSATIVEIVQDAGNSAKERAAQSASSWRAWFEEGLVNLSKTRVGQGIKHLGQAIKPVADKATSGLKHAKSKIESLLRKGQSLPPKVKEEMDKWQEAAIHLASLKAENDSAKLSYAAISEINGLWGQMQRMATSNDAFTKFVRDTYMSSVRPTLQKALTALESVHHINAANYNFLSTQMDANLQTELHMQKFLAEKAKAAHAAMQQENSPSLKKTMYEALSWGLPMLSWVFLSSQTLIVLPFVMQRMVPHVLRSCASSLQNNSKAFWFTLANAVPEKGVAIGSWLQKTFNTLTGHIDPERIRNFKALSCDEQEYLFSYFGSRDVKETLQAIDRSQKRTLEVEPMSLSEYFELSSSQQEDILFTVTRKDFNQFRAALKATNNRLRKILADYSKLQPQELAIMTPSRLRAMTKEKVEHLVRIIHTYHPEYAHEMKLQHKIDIYKILTTQHRVEREILYQALAYIYNKLPLGEQQELLKLTQEEYDAMTPGIKRELALFLRQEGDDGVDSVARFNDLEPYKQAEFREQQELSKVQKEAILKSLEKEIGEESLKLQAIKRRITKLSDGEFLAKKEQVQATKRALTLSPTTKLKKQLEEDVASLEKTSKKLAHLHELEESYTHKLRELNVLLGNSMDEVAVEEAPHVASLIDDTLNQTLNEVGKSIMHALIEVSKENNQAIKFSRDFFDKAIELRKKHVLAVEARIAHLKSELAHAKKEKNYEAMTDTRLQLRAHTNFTLKLNRALLAKFQELRASFDERIPQATTTAAAAA